WLRDARSAIMGRVTLAELEAAVRPMRAWDPTRKAQIRPFKEQVEAKLRAQVRAELGVKVPTPAAPTMIPAVPANMAIVAQTDITLASALSTVVAESRENAAVQAPQDMNAVAGYNSAQGYAQAAARAVTQATRDQYIAQAAAGGITVDPS